MIKLNETGQSGPVVAGLAYAERRGVAGRLLLPVTRHLRAVNAARYVKPAHRHLDIGCGDGYFLRMSPCRERYGVDRLLGDDISERLDFPDEYFDYVTMLAVLEHLDDPRFVIEEIFRVLKPCGRLVITTPRRRADVLIRLYAKRIDDQHKAYFDSAAVRKLTEGLFNIAASHSFILGLNQVFCLEKI
jgi:SAM-dependent methyltransferase